MSCKQSAVSSQLSAVSGQLIADIAILCLDAVAHGGNHGSRSWLEVTVRQLSLNQ
ncbi:hypothetical protein [Moorena producens]|uniref:hypothetical protein n=1 Tax=Moorena producens TaxID=1155739 RepID=UPI00131413D4|nr:hypothetical protein [Moorena producens]